MFDEEVRAQAKAWEYAFGYVKRPAVACAVELGIPDFLENHEGPVSLFSLSSAVSCPPESLYRLMRFLCFHGIFKATDSRHQNHPSQEDFPHCIHYVQTTLSRLFTSDKIAPFLLLNSAARAAQGLPVELLRTGKHPDKFKSADGEDTWTDPDHGYHTNSFTKAMTNHARITIKALVDNYSQGFQGIGTLVDVGGRHGLAVGTLVKAFPSIRGICFDLPEIVAKAPQIDGIEFVGGSMFESVPKADAVMLMWILHDWSDEVCIDILKKCKEAVPVHTGKVMIVDVVIDESGGDEFTAAHLALDLVMMDVTVKGKERTYAEWSRLLDAAGFTRYCLKNIKTLESVIEAYP